MNRLKYNRRMRDYMRIYRKKNGVRLYQLQKVRLGHRRVLINKFKDRPCMDCGIKYNPWQMEFDHRKPMLKEFTISCNLLNSLDVVKKEMRKCDVVCANCHKQRTHDRITLCAVPLRRRRRRRVDMP